MGFRIPVRFDELNKVSLARPNFGIPQATSKEFIPQWLLACEWKRVFRMALTRLEPERGSPGQARATVAKVRFFQCGE